MTMSAADRLARSRFAMLTLIRLIGVALTFGGLVVATTDLIRDGGAPFVGLPIALAGLIESLLLPKMFAARWRSPPDDPASDDLTGKRGPRDL